MCHFKRHLVLFYFNLLVQKFFEFPYNMYEWSTERKFFFSLSLRFYTHLTITITILYLNLYSYLFIYLLLYHCFKTSKLYYVEWVSTTNHIRNSLNPFKRILWNQGTARKIIHRFTPTHRITITFTYVKWKVMSEKNMKITEVIKCNGAKAVRKIPIKSKALF